MKLRNEMLKTAIQHADSEIHLHKMNVEVYLTNPAGIGEHSDIMEAIQVELDKMASAHDRKEMLTKYFK
jgi:hypothetical protein|tara:strand:+ start:531 stop:737 length:207 start_codon:yes stop_codon:yes gene_type:complete